MRLRLRVLVVDDDAAGRRALKQLLIDTPEVRSVGEAATLGDTLAAMYRVRIFRKLETTTHAGLIRYAQRHGLVG